jgi:Gpi18-like mannosyltransferase
MEYIQAKRGKTIAITVILFCSVCYLFQFMGGFAFDIECWHRWILYIHNNGLSNTYHSDTNYLPFYQYIMWLYSKIAGSEEVITANLKYLRGVTLLFDFIGLWYVYKWLDNKTTFLAVLLINILNICYAYNTVVWGQLDGISATMAFMAIYFAYKGKNIWSAFWMILAINMKLQVIIFIPVWGLLCLNNIFDTRDWKQIVWVLLTIACTQVLLLVPFIMNGTVSLVWNVIAGSVDFNPVIVKGAASVWFFVPNINPWHLSDANRFIAGLNYKQAGLLMFCLSSFAAMWPLIKNVFLKITGKGFGIEVSKQQIWLMSAIVALSFFYFNTQMHERYSHPAFIFITVYAFYSKNFLPYIIFSIAYFINLERVLDEFKIIHGNTVIGDFRFISGLFGFVLVSLFVSLYRSQTPKKA